MKTEKIVVRIEKELKDSLKSIGKTKGLTLSSTINLILSKYKEKWEKKN